MMSTSPESIGEAEREDEAEEGEAKTGSEKRMTTETSTLMIDESETMTELTTLLTGKHEAGTKVVHRDTQTTSTSNPEATEGTDTKEMVIDTTTKITAAQSEVATEILITTDLTMMSGLGTKMNMSTEADRNQSTSQEEGIEREVLHLGETFEVQTEEVVEISVQEGGVN